MPRLHGETGNWSKSCSSVLLLDSLIITDKYQWHDDGEKDLGPDIASLSLGGAATMTFRMKAKHWLAKNLSSDNYDPELPVQTGSQAYQFRNIVNEHYKAGRMAEYERTKAELLKYYNKDEKKKKHAPTSLTLELKHGDMVVMHGAEIQKIWEVWYPCVKFSLTTKTYTCDLF